MSIVIPINFFFKSDLVDFTKRPNKQRIKREQRTFFAFFNKENFGSVHYIHSYC